MLGDTYRTVLHEVGFIVTHNAVCLESRLPYDRQRLNSRVN